MGRPEKTPAVFRVSMEARNKAIADAFAWVAICALYCDRWITDYDFVRIMACEHNLASDDTTAFDVVLINKALKADGRFKGAEDPDGREAGTVFRKDYSPTSLRFLTYFLIFGLSTDSRRRIASRVSGMERERSSRSSCNEWRRQRKKRFHDALICFEELRLALKTINNQPPWGDYERDNDLRILNKTPFMVSRRFFGYATEDNDAYKENSNQYHHIVFTDRNNIPRMDQIAGTQKLHPIAGFSDSKRPGEVIGNDQFYLVVGSYPCACLACRGLSTEKCPFEHIRNEEELWARQRRPQDVARPNTNEKAASKQYEAELKTILGTDNITVSSLMDALRKLNLPLSGLKHESAERLVRYHRVLREIPTVARLACDYIMVDDDELDDDGDCD